MRFREYPQAAHNNYDDDALMTESEDNTIANFGKFGIAKVWRNFGSEPIQLDAFATRIFGIGMHKTGTTSLHKALKILGIDSAHWKDAHWPRQSGWR